MSIFKAILTWFGKNKIFVYIALIVAIAFLITYLCLDNKRLREALTDTRIELNVKTNVLETYRDKNGNLHAKIDQYAKTIHELQTTYDSIEQAMYANAKAAKIKDRQIQALKYALFTSKDSLIGVIDILSKQDTLDIDNLLIEYERTINFDNKNLKAQVIVPLVETKPFVLTYEYSAEAYITERWYRPKSDFFLWNWFGMSFKKKVNEFDFRLSDPNAQIKVLRDIKVE